MKINGSIFFNPSLIYISSNPLYPSPPPNSFVCTFNAWYVQYIKPVKVRLLPVSKTSDESL